MAPISFFILITFLFIPANTQNQSNEKAFISVFVSQRGLDFAKDILIKQAISSLTPLELPQIQKSSRIPLVGDVQITLSNITIYHVDVSSSIVKPGDMGVTIVASGATANLSMKWGYSYNTWFIEISDDGSASVMVEGMEVGLTLGLENQEGTLKLSLVECGCYVEDISITLDGAASWFYQVLVDAFDEQIRSAVENSITKKMKEGISKLDSLLKTLPKEIPVDDVAALNITFVNEPMLSDTSIGFDIDGLFTTSRNVIVPNYYKKSSEPSKFCSGSTKMVGISLDEAVFNSGSVVYFEAGLLQWIVDKVPDQAFLNTARWKYIVPKLYQKYPDKDMILNISLISSPVIRISSTHSIGTTALSEMTINVLDANETIQVACISLVAHAFISVNINGNNLAGNVKLDDFTLSLKWSEIGNFHMHLIQSLIRTFLGTILLPYINLRLGIGFPLPILRGFTLQNAEILCANSRILVCSDLVFQDM